MAQEQQTSRQPVDGVGLDVIDLGAIAAAFSEYRRLAMAIIASTTVAATGFAFILPNVYEVNVTLAPAASTSSGASALSSLGGLASLAGLSGLSSKDPMQEHIAVLKSRELTTEFIRSRDLMPVLFPKYWDSASKSWNTDDPEEIPSYDDALMLWEKKVITVSMDSFTGMVTLTIAWRDREKAATWARDLVNLLNDRLRQRAIEEANLSMKYLQDELSKTNSLEIQQSIYRLMEAQVNKAMLAEVQKDFAFRVIDPPTVPDADNYARPNRPVLIALGFVFGFIVSALVVVHRRVKRLSGRV